MAVVGTYGGTTVLVHGDDYDKVAVTTLLAACLQAAVAEFPAAEQYEVVEQYEAEAEYKGYEFAWFDFPLAENGGVYACSLDESNVAVVELSDGNQTSSLRILDTKTRTVTSQPDWGNIPNDDLMLEEAEAKIRAWYESRGVGPIDRLVAKDAPWREAPASDGQINLLMKMYPEEGDWTTITKGHAAQKITIKAMARAMGMEGEGGGQVQAPGGAGAPPTAKQLEFIRSLVERTPAGNPDADELRGLGDRLAGAVRTKWDAKGVIDRLQLVAAPRAQGQGQGRIQASHAAEGAGGGGPPTAKQLSYIEVLLERTPNHPEAERFRDKGGKLETKKEASELIDKLLGGQGQGQRPVQGPVQGQSQGRGQGQEQGQGQHAGSAGDGSASAPSPKQIAYIIRLLREVPSKRPDFEEYRKMGEGLASRISKSEAAHLIGELLAASGKKAVQH